MGTCEVGRLPQTVPGATTGNGGAPGGGGAARAGFVIRRANGTSFDVGIDTRVGGMSFGGIF